MKISTLSRKGESPLARMTHALDYCNALYPGMPWKSQMAQNAAPHMLLEKVKFQHLLYYRVFWIQVKVLGHKTV